MKKEQDVGGLLKGLADKQNADLNQQKYNDTKAAAQANAEAQKPFLAEALTREKLTTTKAQEDYYQNRDKATPSPDANDPYLAMLEQYNAGIGNKDPRMSTAHYSYLASKYGEEAADFFMNQNRPKDSTVAQQPSGGRAKVVPSANEPFRGLSATQIPDKANPFKGAPETATSQYDRLNQADIASQVPEALQGDLEHLGIIKIPQVSFSKGVDEVAKVKGFPGVVDFMQDHSPALAKQAIALNQELNSGMDTSSVMQTLSAKDKLPARQEGYRALAGIGQALLKADPKDRSAMYKQMLPMIQAINPNAPKVLDAKATSMLMVAGAHATPAGEAANYKEAKMTAIADFEDKTNKIQEIMERGPTLNDKDTLLALAANATEARKQMNNAGVVALTHYLKSLNPQPNMNLASDPKALQGVQQLLTSKQDALEQALKANEQERDPKKFEQNMAQIKAMQAEYKQLAANAENGNIGAIQDSMKVDDARPGAAKAAVTANQVVSQDDATKAAIAAKNAPKEDIDRQEEQKKQQIAINNGKATMAFGKDIAQASKTNLEILDLTKSAKDIISMLHQDPTNSHAQGQLRGLLLKIVNKGSTSDPDYVRGSIATGVDWVLRETNSVIKGQKQVMSPNEIAIARRYVDQIASAKLQTQLEIEDGYRPAVAAYKVPDAGPDTPSINWDSIPVPSNRFTGAQARWVAGDVYGVPPEMQERFNKAVAKGIPYDKIMRAIRTDLANGGS